MDAEYLQPTLLPIDFHAKEYRVNQEQHDKGQHQSSNLEEPVGDVVGYQDTKRESQRQHPEVPRNRSQHIVVLINDCARRTEHEYQRIDAQDGEDNPYHRVAFE